MCGALLQLPRFGWCLFPKSSMPTELEPVVIEYHDRSRPEHDEQVHWPGQAEIVGAQSTTPDTGKCKGEEDSMLSQQAGKLGHLLRQFNRRERQSHAEMHATHHDPAARYSESSFSRHVKQVLGGLCSY
jgi:hypothetical protein